MGKTAIALSSVLVLAPLITIRAQESPRATQTGGLETVVVARETKSDSVITIPPATEQRFNAKQKIGSGSGLGDLVSSAKRKK